ncbi:MAG: nitrous oxide reductase accessory protein NosL [Betaproteobacteria bacterium]|nr:nitrous oxide reductase accessory protein NosL [Betaproteobacteria bacterium]
MRLTRSRFFALAALVVVFAVACGKRGNWPEGMAPIHWDRDTCAQCNMAISDPRFAVELLHGNPKKTAFKFDDIGCLIAWTNALSKRTGERPWWEASEARVWVADFNSPVDNREALRWLDARVARYIERSSPMGHNLAAVGEANEKNIGFDEILRHGEHAHRHGDGHGEGR